MDIAKTGLGIIVLALSLVSGGCQQREGAPNAAVEQAIKEHLSSRSGLGLGKMVMEMKQVQVQGDTAEADVVFRTTTGTPAQMDFHYKLHRDGGQWKVETSQPGNAESSHPPAEAPKEGDAQGAMPEGHPPVGEAPPPK